MITAKPITKVLSDGSTLVINQDGTTFRTFVNGGTVITLSNGDQRYISPTNKEMSKPNQASILSASLNAESEKIRARQLFNQERAKVDAELRQAISRKKARSNFNSVAFTESLLDKMNQGKYR